MVFAPGANRVVTSIADSLAQNKVPHEVFSGREAKRRYPHQLKIPDEYTCVFEDGGGILKSQNAVAAFQVHIVHVYTVCPCLQSSIYCPTCV